MQAETRRLKMQIEFLLGVTKTGLDIIDGDLNIRYIDPEWQKVYGPPAGQKCYVYFMGRQTPCPECGVLKALQTRQVAVTVARGENSGQSLTYYNVGRRRQKLGVWDGRAARWTLPLADIRRDGVDAVAVIVQSGSAESPGPILGAAFASLP